MRRFLAKAMVLLAVVAGTATVASAPASAQTAPSHRVTTSDWHW